MNWRVPILIAALLATAGVGAGWVEGLGFENGYVPLRAFSALLSVLLLFSLGGRAFALTTRNVPVMLFLAWSVLSLLWTTSISATLTTLLGLLGLIALAVSMTLMARSVRVDYILFWTFSATTVISILLALFVPSVGAVTVQHPTEGTLVQPIGVFIWNSDFGFSAGLAAVLGLGIAFRDRKFALLPLVLVNLFGVWYSNSAVSLIVVAFALLVLVLLQHKYIALAILALGALGVLAGGLAFGFMPLLERVLGLLGRSTTLTGRVDLWEETLRQSAEHPVLGFGAGVGPDLTRLTAAGHAHNGFIQTLFDRGWIGVALMATLIIVVISRATKDQDKTGISLIAMIFIANLGNDYLTFASLGLTVLLWQSYAHVRGEYQRIIGAPKTIMNRPRRAWVSAEIREELEELLLMIEKSDVAYVEIRIDAPQAVLEKMALPSSIKNKQGSHTKIVQHPYSHKTGINRAAKAIGLVQFLWRLGLHRPDIVVSGFSMLKHRLTAAWLEVCHVAYIRGVVFDPKLTMGISDSVRFGKIGRLLPKKVFATYFADLVLTVGEVNREFLLGRGLPPEQIRLVGPVWLDAIAPTSQQPTHRPGKEIFLTVAWEVHGRQAEHEAQLALTQALAKRKTNGREFMIRVHPRDIYPYENDPIFTGIRLDRSLPTEFLSGLTSADVIVAPLSTLAFEAMYLGHGVVFYSDPIATHAYNNVYELLGINPASTQQLIENRIQSTTQLSRPVFSPVDWSAVKNVF